MTPLPTSGDPSLRQAQGKLDSGQAPHDERTSEQSMLDDLNQPDDDALCDELADWEWLSEWAMMDFEAMVDSAMETQPALWENATQTPQNARNGG